MAVEFAPAYERVRFSPISWAAVFASLVVGISVMLLLTLAGLAVGITVIDPAADSPRAITMGAAIWQTVSMLIAALVGGYVAARLSGLRRTGDGVLHGAVSWGATTLLYAVLALTALGTLTAGLFGIGPSAERVAAAAGPMLTEREQAQRTLESIGLTRDQARTVIDQLASVRPIGATAGAGAGGQTNAAPAVSPTGEQPGAPQPGLEAPGQPQPPSAPQPFATQPPIAQTPPPLEAQPAPPVQQPPFGASTAFDDLEALGAATAWLAGAVLLALLFSMGGGAIGVRGVRRTSRRLDQRPVAPAMASEPPPRVMSRPTASTA